MVIWKTSVFILNYRTKVANVITYNNTDIHTVQAHVAKFHLFWLKWICYAWLYCVPMLQNEKNKCSFVFQSTFSTIYCMFIYFFFLFFFWGGGGVGVAITRS